MFWCAMLSRGCSGVVLVVLLAACSKDEAAEAAGCEGASCVQEVLPSKKKVDLSDPPAEAPPESGWDFFDKEGGGGASGAGGKGSSFPTNGKGGNGGASGGSAAGAAGVAGAAGGGGAGQGGAGEGGSAGAAGAAGPGGAGGNAGAGEGGAAGAAPLLTCASEKLKINPANPLAGASFGVVFRDATGWAYVYLDMTCGGVTKAYPVPSDGITGVPGDFKWKWAGLPGCSAGPAAAAFIRDRNGSNPGVMVDKCTFDIAP